MKLGACLSGGDNWLIIGSSRERWWKYLLNICSKDTNLQPHVYVPNLEILQRELCYQWSELSFSQWNREESRLWWSLTLSKWTIFQRRSNLRHERVDISRNSNFLAAVNVKDVMSSCRLRSLWKHIPARSKAFLLW